MSGSETQQTARASDKALMAPVTLANRPNCYPKIDGVQRVDESFDAFMLRVNVSYTRGSPSVRGDLAWDTRFKTAELLTQGLTLDYAWLAAADQTGLPMTQQRRDTFEQMVAANGVVRRGSDQQMIASNDVIRHDTIDYCGKP